MVVSSAPARSIFGMPVSVRRVVNLSRLPSDREWELLVGELRNTFNDLNVCGGMLRGINEETIQIVVMSPAV